MPLGLQCRKITTRPPIRNGLAFRFVPLMVLIACSGKPSGAVSEPIAKIGETISGDAIVATDTGRVSPEDTEVCDGIDNDGDGEIDEGLLNTYYIDGDGDGYGSDEVEACETPDGCTDTGGGVHHGGPDHKTGAGERRHGNC